VGLWRAAVPSRVEWPSLLVLGGGSETGAEKAKQPILPSIYYGV